jgi:hypothetical protein
MIKTLALSLLASCALTAGASTITFQPTSQTVNLGASTTVDVLIGGLAPGVALGAFDLFVTSNSAIISATNVTFFSNLGAPGSQITGTTFSNLFTEGAETSLAATAALLALQSTQPFSLFELTYKGVGVGTSSLNLGNLANEYITDGGGIILPNPTVTAGSITVLGTVPVTTTPEPSTWLLVTSGAGMLTSAIKRRRTRPTPTC